MSAPGKRPDEAIARLKEVVRSDMNLTGDRSADLRAVLAYVEHLEARLNDVRPLFRVHAGAEVARRVLVDGIEAFKSTPQVHVFLLDLLDALDGGSRKKGLLALGDTPEERMDKGMALARSLPTKEEG